MYMTFGKKKRKIKRRIKLSRGPPDPWLVPHISVVLLWDGIS